jgi:hypothetical protein
LKILRTKWASLALIVTMLFSLLPPLTANAAATLKITNLYAPLGTAADPYKDELANKFTVNPITIDFLFNGVPDDQITNIYYEIYNSNTGVNTVVTTNKAVKSTTNSSQASFLNVQLYPGLNKITIKYGQSGSVASTPGYAYYTPVTNITKLQFNGEDFIDGGIYPKRAPYTGVSITGTSLNANSVEANNQGTVYQPAAFTNGDFTFVTNTGRPTDIEFNPGDNIATFAALNVTNYYTATRNFIYDNGKAFAYNGLIDLNGTGPSQKLVKSPVLKPVSGSGIKDVTLAADFKVPLATTNSTVTQYVYAEVFTSGMGSTKLTFDFANSALPNKSTIGKLHSGADPAVTISLSPTKNPDYYTYHFTGELPVNPNSSFQEVYFQFKDANGLVTTSKYNYSFVDPDQPYVEKVNINRQPAAGGTPYEATISEAGTTQISEFPANLKVYTSPNAKFVEIQLNDVKYNGSSANQKLFPVTGGVASVDLQGITDGPTVLKVIPYLDDVAGAGYVAGTKQYNLVISGAPYAIINNIFNGIVVKSSSQISCGSTANGPCISGRVVNLPEADLLDIVYTLNDNIILTPSVPPTKANNGSFKIDGTQLVNNLSKDGKYTFKIQLKVNKVLVTTSSIDIFILSDDVPTVNYLRPLEADALNAQFIATSQADNYVTRALAVQLQGETLNSAIPTNSTAPGTRLYLRKAPSSYKDIAVGAEISLASTLSSPPLQSFATAAIPLTEYGEYVFELVSTNNSSGSTASKLVSITREPVPYAFVSPRPSVIIKNSKGIDQANINQNFYMIEIQADNADSVTFGKEQAIFNKTTKTYLYEAKGLKVGANQIKFTVNRGTAKTNGTIVLFNTNTTIEGMQYKVPLATNMKIFNGDMLLKFPKDTKLMRNDRENQQVISSDRQILFGIANNNDGRIDKPNESLVGVNYLVAPAHFKTASKKIWIDGGIIKPTAGASNPELQEAFLGSGILPNTTNALQTPFYIRNYSDLVIPTEPGTLTIKYDSNIRADAAKYVSVFQFGYFNNPSGQGPALPSWKNIGGKVDPKNNIIEVPVSSFGYFQVMYMDDSFNDVTNHPWARDDLDTLFSKGIMSSKTPYQFMPNDPIGRGEFVTMMVKVFDIPLVNLDTQQNSYNNNAATFLDVQKGYTDPLGLYDFLSIEAAARAGIVRGNANGSFLPRSAITRQDAAVVIARARELKLNPDTNKSLAALQKLFTDANSIQFYAVPSVEAIAKAGIIQGKDNVLLQGQKKLTQRFDPTENFTRAEAAAVAVRILKQLNKIPK